MEGRTTRSVREKGSRYNFNRIIRGGLTMKVTSGQISEGGKESRASTGKRGSGRRSSRCEIPEEENAKYAGGSVRRLG